LAWLGLAWLGLAWLGLAWLGSAWLGSQRSAAAQHLRVLLLRNWQQLHEMVPCGKIAVNGCGANHCFSSKIEADF
jgi:hypothetical protein